MSSPSPNRHSPRDPALTCCQAREMDTDARRASPHRAPSLPLGRALAILLCTSITMISALQITPSLTATTTQLAAPTLRPNSSSADSPEVAPVEKSSLGEPQPQYLADVDSAGDVIEFVDNNLIAVGSMEAADAPPDETSAKLLGSAGKAAAKSRRHVEHQVKSADWWTRVSRPQQEQSAATGGSTKRATASAKPRAQTDERFVYREQPLKQNEIVTLRYQLDAIDIMRRRLVARPVDQLQRLDNRLVESYRLCLKKKMPLYAGMLYRTRDFVVRMAGDLRHERKVLDAMSRRVNTLLRDRMANQTLVKEYNKWRSAGTETSVSVETSTELVVTKLAVPRVRKNIQQRTVESATVISTETSVGVAQTKTGEQQRAVQWSEILEQAAKTRGKTRAKTAARKQPKTQLRYTVNVNEVNLKKELRRSQQLIDKVNVSCHDLSGVIDDIIYLFKLTADDSLARKGGQANKVGKLLTQIATSSGSDGGLMDQSQAKRLLKSPIRVFFERYGRLTMDSSAAAATSIAMLAPTTAPPPAELRPLFDDGLEELRSGFDEAAADSTPK